MNAYQENIDKMYAVFHEAWKGSTRITRDYIDKVTDAPPVEYDNAEPLDLQKGEKPFARVVHRPATARRISVGGEKKMYESTGLVIIQVFVPYELIGGVTMGRALAKLVQSAYRGVADKGGLWYREITIFERPPEPRWREFTIHVEYNFTELE